MKFNPPGPMIDPASKYPVITGCPAQAKAIPPQVADTMTTTRSDISLKSSCNTGYFDLELDMMKTLS
jgi:hypothetical protein